MSYMFETKVPAQRFSRVLKQSNANVIKMDIEGAEWNILSDRTVDWSDVDMLMLEWHSSWMKDTSGDKLRWVLEHLKLNFPTVINTEPTHGSKALSFIYATKR